jgi:chromosome partitioning protein
MRTISLLNQEGGCGKTTSSINLAACLAHLNQRTLLVDMDPQGHCAVGLALPDGQIGRSVYDVLRIQGGGGATLKDITWQIASSFDLAPAGSSPTPIPPAQELGAPPAISTTGHPCD